MNLKFNRKQWINVCLCTALTSAAFGVSAFADDMGTKKDTMAKDSMAKDGMANDMHMTDPMLHSSTKMIKDGMMSDAGKMQMSSELAKMMVMQKMSAMMCADEKCMMTTTQDPDVAKMVESAKKMVADPEKAKALEAQIMSDPAAMKTVMMMSLAKPTMMMKEEMNMKKMDNKMESGTMAPAMSQPGQSK